MAADEPPQVAHPEPLDEELAALRANIRSEQRAMARRLVSFGGLLAAVGVAVWVGLRMLARHFAGRGAGGVVIPQIVIVAPVAIIAGLVLLVLGAALYCRARRA